MTDLPPSNDMTPGEQYLWDNTGTPDTATSQFELALRPLNFAPQALPAPAPLRFTRRISGRWVAIGLAASLLLLASAMYLPALLFHRSYTGWTIVTRSGMPRIVPINAGLPDAKSRITTDTSSAATFKAKSGVQVRVGNSSDATLSSSDTNASVALTSGETTIQVPDTCEPTRVETAAVGCTVAPGGTATIRTSDGRTQVSVQSGWAQVGSDPDATRLTETWACSVGPKSTDPWPPYRITKGGDSGTLTKKIDQLLHAKIDPKSQYVGLEQALKTATPKDAVLLWNLFPRVNDDTRRLVRNRLAQLLKSPPASPAYENVLTLDPDALDQWWQAILSQSP